LAEAARDEAVGAERLSRLASRAVAPFEAALATLTRRGRPPKSTGEHDREHELALTRALLDVARSLLERISRRRRPLVRALLVGAWLRLHEAHPALTQKRFCDALALSTRTLRHWMKHVPVPSSPQPSDTTTAPKPRTRPRRRPRFRYDTVLPDTQHAADTTDVRAFGVGLKLIAVQDVGGRDQDLLDAVVVDDHESAELVTRALEQALAELPGAQLLTDQGTPYMAKETLDALARLGVEHAPQKEGDPQGKSTVERAFGTLKSIAAPLLAITDKLAARVPALANPELARATVHVLVTALLRAYQAGARATRRALDARGAISPDELARAATEQRGVARADERSSRLILARIHEAYALPGAARTFADQYRRYSPAVLLEAEKRFASQVHRDDIRDRKSYFAAILRAVSDEQRRARNRELRDHELHERIERDLRAHDAQLARWRQDPASWLRDALDALAAEWIPAAGSLLLGGAGIGRAWLRGAIERLVALDASAAHDIASALLRDWSRANLDRLGPEAIDAVLAAAHPHLDAIPKVDDTHDCAARFASAMLPSTGPPRRPAPQKPLRT
jgi:transposase InsO family protein